MPYLQRQSARGAVKIAVLLPALMLVASGCRHKPTAVAAPPPPPAIAPAAGAGAVGAGTARPGGSSGAAVPTAPGGNELLIPQGPPISSEVGVASWYGTPYKGRKASDGSVYDEDAMTAAHRTLPLGSIVRVTNLTNGQQVLVRITDRGPFVDGRIIDLSPAAAKAINMYRAGISKVRLEAYGPPAGSDAAGRWCVQIGAFLDPADALQLKNDLKRRYASAKVIEFASSTGHWVRIDPKVDDRATAEEIADSIHIPDPNAAPYVIRLN